MIPFRDNIPSSRYPVMTVAIIAINVAAFLYEMTLDPDELQAFLHNYGVVPATLGFIAQSPLAVLGQVSTSLFSSTVLHGGLLHLIGNMWYLWIFGDNIEDRLGRLRFLAFYLICGALAGMAHIAFNPHSSIPTIGASGAVAGVLGAYLVSYPFARVLTLLPFLFIWIVEIPAAFLLGFWFLMQFLSGTVEAGSTAQLAGGVAWWAHIGGFLAGMLLVGRLGRRPLRRVPRRR